MQAREGESVRASYARALRTALATRLAGVDAALG